MCEGENAAEYECAEASVMQVSLPIGKYTAVV